MRAKLDKFKVENSKQAMDNFRKALAQVVNVPKAHVDQKRKQAKARNKRKRQR